MIETRLYKNVSLKDSQHPESSSRRRRRQNIDGEKYNKSNFES